jgi:hypothetical protein
MFRAASIIPSETSVDNHFTRQYNPEDSSEHHTRRRENLKSHILRHLWNQILHRRTQNSPPIVSSRLYISQVASCLHICDKNIILILTTSCVLHSPPIMQLLITKCPSPASRHSPHDLMLIPCG